MSARETAAGEHLGAVLSFYDTHPINETQILEKLARDGVDTAGLTERVLKDYDQDHFGGVEAVDRLAELAGVDGSTEVLDVCSGMGGPARYLADRLGCRVRGIDMTRSRVEAAARLTRMVGLDDLVAFECANALDNPFPDASFDVVMSEEAFAHIPDKARLVAECVRVLRPGGRIAFTDILAGGAITDAVRAELRREMAFIELAAADDYRGWLLASGCEVERVEDLSGIWTEILVDRLAMYRSLERQTVARFGRAHFVRWDRAYAHFVGCYRTGELGGARFVARRAR